MKYFTALLLLWHVAYAYDFKSFLDEALEKSPYLKSQNLGIDEAKTESERLNRYKNPSLELEASHFATSSSQQSGYRLGFSQPLRLWGVAQSNESLSLALLQSAQKSFSQKRAFFIRTLSELYVAYKMQKLKLELVSKELEIAKTILAISQARYKAGTISKGLAMQAKISFDMVAIKKNRQELALLDSYYNLLAFAGFKQEIALDTVTRFYIKDKAGQNPELLALKEQQNRALKEADVNSHSVSWLDLFAEYEKEPEQGIARVGLSMPLALFNTRAQERQLALLKANRLELEYTNRKRQANLTLYKLKKAQALLKRQEEELKRVLKDETDLLKMFQEGYKVANIKLLQLQDIKNRLIATQSRLIETQSAMDSNAIRYNYLQGAYND